MYAKYGDRTIYDNFEVGIAEFEGEDEFAYLAFTDSDNEMTHLFKMEKGQAMEFTKHIQEHLGKKKVEVYSPTDMPKGVPNGG